MGLRINTNVQSLVAQHRLDATRQKLEHTQNKLSSGSRIIKAMDDAAGLAISEALRATIRSTDKNIINANDGMYLLETADSSLKEITDIVIRMKELTIQAASDTLGDKERGYLQSEVNSIRNELNRISNATVFNGRELINGNAGNEIQIQVGPNNNETVDRIALNFDFSISTDALDISGVDISSAQGARDAIDVFSNALDKISFVRGSLGASEASLSSTIRNLMSYKENVTGAFAQIRDADVAHETAESAKYSIMTQAGVAVLAQANAGPQIALKLLQ
jgi:flagellin